MSAVRATRLTEAEYLELERTAEERHEYVNGEVYAMAGASFAHELAVANVLTALNNRLAGRPCKAYGSNLRVRIDATGMYCYPDVTVVCGKAEVVHTRPDSLLNPKVIVEVLSTSTESYDHGAKAAHFRRMPSLDAYVFVSTSARRVEVMRRNPDASWTLTEAADGGEIRIECLDLLLPLDEVYAGWENLPDPEGA